MTKVKIMLILILILIVLLIIILDMNHLINLEKNLRDAPYMKEEIIMVIELAIKL